MRIVMVANWWYRRGGLGAVMLDEAEELVRRGHEVIPFASAHPENLPTPWSAHFPEYRELSDAGRTMSLPERVSTAARLVNNFGAAERFGAVLAEVEPDVVHFHGAARQLSASVVGVAHSRGVPAVMTQHDYQLVCPQGYLLKGGRLPCTPPDCTNGNPLQALTNRCVKGGLAPSAVAAFEYGLGRARGRYAGRVEFLIAPSHFMDKTLSGAGFDRARIRFLANGIAPLEEPVPLPMSGGCVLYAGRLSVEKGLPILLEAARLLPDVPFVVAGDGPLRRELEAAAPPSVRFVGHLDPEQLRQTRLRSVATVLPATWHENAPIAVLESLRDARPAVVTDRGGQPELVEGGAGIVVPGGDASALAVAIDGLWADRSRARAIGEAGRARLLSHYTLASHVTGLEALYAEAVSSATSRSDRGRSSVRRANRA